MVASLNQASYLRVRSEALWDRETPVTCLTYAWDSKGKQLLKAARGPARQLSRLRFLLHVQRPQINLWNSRKAGRRKLTPHPTNVP